MNKHILLFLLLFFYTVHTPLIARQVSVTLEQGGTLAEALKGEENITELIISGEMNDEDFQVINDEDGVLSQTLTRVDISGVNLATLPDNAFQYCSNLTSVILPTTLTSIGYSAFSDCPLLQEVTLPEQIRQLGMYCFSGCESLEQIAIPEGVTEIPRRAFENCTSLINATLPSTLKRIGAGAFWGTGFAGILFPEGLEIIEEDAFYQSRLKKITLPKSLQSLGINAFTNCPQLSSISVASGNHHFTGKDGVLFNADFTSLLCYPAGKKDTHYEVPPTVTSLGKLAFHGAFDRSGKPLHSYLTSVLLPDGLKVIEESAFSGCFELKQLELPASVEKIGPSAFFYSGLEKITIPDKIKVLDELVFYSCLALKEVNLPEGLQTINDYAFNECRALVNIHIPTGVTELGYGVFYQCSSLEKVNIPEGINTLYYGFFYMCTSLTEFKLPSTLETLENIFSFCTELSQITLPASLRHFDLGAFNGCEKLLTLYCLAEVPPVPLNYDFSSFQLPEDAIIYVPDASVETYKQDPIWGIFGIRPLSASGIEDPTTRQKKDFDVFFSPDGTVELNAPRKGVAELYSPDGTLLYKSRIEAGKNRLDVMPDTNVILVVYASVTGKRTSTLIFRGK